MRKAPQSQKMYSEAEVSALRAELDNAQSDLSHTKTHVDNLVNEINRLNNELKQATSKSLAYQIVIGDLIKRN